MSLQTGQVLDGKYKIVRVIGEGGMGAVYEGENVRIRRRVAIKLLHAGIASNTEMTQRFEREAQVAGTVGNDHILEVLDLGAMPGGERYMVMEYLDGETMTDRIKVRGRLTPREAVQLLRQVLRGLSAAHAAGIVHRDLKPDNIFILREKAGIRDYVKIIDFGISKFSEVGGVSSRMTRTGALMGTPHYMAPEQATGSTDIDRRTDIYAVGIIMYEAVTGRVPFQAETFNQLLFEIALAKIIPARQVVPDLDPAIESIIMKASARDPAHRFQNSDEFIAALDAWERSGSAVSLPPEQSIEAIVAATVPRAMGGFGSNDATINADTGTGRTSRSSVGRPVSTAGTPSGNVPGMVPSGSVPGTVPSAGGPPFPVDPTVNTWANTSQVGTPQRSAAPIVAATLMGVLLLAGAAIGAYLFLKAPAVGPVPAASNRPEPTQIHATTTAETPPPPSSTVEVKAANTAPTATAAPSIEPAATEHAGAHQVGPAGHHKPAEKPKVGDQPKQKPGGSINFGY